MRFMFPNSQKKAAVAGINCTHSFTQFYG